jgi:N-dimethylarginine dimethylaminohydrolase
MNLPGQQFPDDEDHVFGHDTAVMHTFDAVPASATFLVRKSELEVELDGLSMLFSPPYPPCHARESQRWIFMLF